MLQGFITSNYDNFDTMTHQSALNMHVQCTKILEDMLYNGEIDKKIYITSLNVLEEKKSCTH